MNLRRLGAIEPPPFGSNYRRLAAARSTGNAIITPAEKLLGIIYKTLKNNSIFEDFRRFVLANA